MEIKKVTEIKELDALIPLIQKRHDEEGSDKYISLIGYFSWVVFNFPLENFQVWKAIKEDVIVGYLIAQITQNYFIKECVIVEALIEENNEEVTSFVFGHIISWAKSKDCKQIKINTKRAKAFAKKYKFDTLGTSMAMKI